MNRVGGYARGLVLGLVIFFSAAAPAAEVASTLTPVVRVTPKYPAAALKEHLSGEVMLEVTVNPDGSVKAVRVEKSDPPGVFDAAAREAVLKWTFKPKVVDGKAVEAKGLQPITFALAESPRELVEDAQRLIAARNPTKLDWKEAFRKLQDAIAKDSKLPWAHYELARYYATSGTLTSNRYVDEDTYEPDALEKAIAAINDELRLQPDDAEVQSYAGYLHAHAHQFLQAQVAFARARQLGGSDWLDVNEAELDWMEGRFAEGKARLDAFLSSGRKNRRVLWYADHFYVRVSCALHEAALAQQAFTRFKSDFPSDPYPYGDYAYNLMYYSGDFRNAEGAARTAVGMQKSGDAKATLAFALYGQWAALVAAGKADDPHAVDLLDEADRLYPAIQLGGNPALKQPTFQAIATALKKQGLYDANDSVTRSVWRQVSHQIARQTGLHWTPAMGIAGALSLLLIFVLRRQARQQAMARERTAPPGPVVDFPSDRDAEQKRVRENFRFTGSGAEYFRIWVVNLLLTIVTLGIYSAWAKVRKLKYFYRNTELAGARFDYHGDPVAILKGRVIAVVLLLAYKYLFDFFTLTGVLTGIGLAVVLPWLMRSSLRFRLRNSSYRGVRFRFDGSLPLAYYVFGVGFVGSLASLYLLAPFFHQRLKAYQHSHALYGQRRFGFDGSVGSFYAIYLKGSLVILAAVTLGAVAAGLFFATLQTHAQANVGVLLVVGVLAFYGAGAVIIAPYFNARVQNLVWNHTRLGDDRFASAQSVRRLGWIYFTNLLGVVATLGFFMPWASVRLARYKAESLSFSGAANLDNVQAGEADATTAAGQETAELFDLDIAL